MAHEFRNLTDDEHRHVKSVAEKLGKRTIPTVKVSFEKQHNFTVCVVKSGTDIFTGVTKRHPSADRQWKAVAATSKSFNRAVHHLFGSIAADSDRTEEVTTAAPAPVRETRPAPKAKEAAK